MLKRGQATIFIILGIIVIAIFGFLFYALNNDILDNPFVSTQTLSVKDYVDGCIEEKGLEVLDLVGRQGGDYSPQDDSNLYFGDFVTYVCDNEGSETTCFNKRPFFRTYVERQITEYVNSRLTDCVDFGIFIDSGYVVNSGDYEVETFIGDYDVSVMVNWPITITKNELVESEEDFSFTFDKPLGKLIDVAEDIIASEVTNGDFTHVPYMLANANEMYIKKDNRNYGVKVYSINLLNDDYVFKIATRSGWG